MKYEKVNSRKTSFFVCALAFMFLYGCNNTKYLTDNQTLLIDSKVECDSKSILQDDLESLQKQKENQKSLFFFRFYTTVYNRFSQGRGTKFKKWIITHIGSEPVLLDETLADKTQTQLLQYMNNKGYYQAKVDKRIIIKNKKSKLYFYITANKPYRLKNITIQCIDSDLLRIISDNQKKTFLLSGANFEVQNLEKERDRITAVLNHTGYYFFEKANILFEADSSLLSNEVNLTVSINPPTVIDSANSKIKNVKHIKYSIRNTFIILDYDYKEVLKNRDNFIKTLDTTKIQENIYLLCKGKPYVNPQVVMNCNYIRNNALYNVSDVEKTKLYLSQNMLFRQTSIEFTNVSVSDTSSNGLLDCYIQISPSTKQSYSINLEGTSTGGDWGAQTKVTYENKNFFRGAEIFTLKLRYSFEQNSFLQTIVNNKFNSRQYGIEIGRAHV